jgi:predicted TIM-barrel fold metal-dependent hydrolase
MKLIDTHQHIWDLSRFTYSWCKDIPKLNRSFLMKDYLEASREAEVAKSVFVECDVDEPFMLDETRWVLSLAEQKDNPIEGVVAACRPERPDFRKYVDQIVGHPKLKGLRRVLHVAPDETSQTALFAENINSLEQYKLSFDLCFAAKQLPCAINLVKQCPGVQFILDHCGVPDVKGKVLDPWRQYIKEIAGFPNVVCKVSGLVAYADPENWTVDDLRPFVEHVLGCFGWDRVMFGSDWPVCTLSATYQRWVEAARELTANASEINKEKLFSKNAERVYRLSASPRPGK